MRVEGETHGGIMQKKLIKSAGPLVAEALYKPRTVSAGRGRGRKSNPTNELQKLVNERQSWQKLKWLLAANFIKGDIVGCLTFDNEHLPETRKQVVNKFGWFKKKAEAARKARGQELVMFWSIEHRHGDGRWHIHIVLNATGGDDYAELHRLWGQGETEFSALRVDARKNYETLARYMCKEARDKVGQRSWSYTRNAKKPEVESFWVDDSTTLRVPKDATVFKDVRSRGEYQYIEFAYDNALRRRRRSRKRRR